MAGEVKKPKIDLKSRIPSKTVKGLTPAAGGVIPPPPGAVPAPPPDLLGRRSVAPKVSADPNDPLGAATVSGGGAPQQQIVVVQAAEQDAVGGAASKKGVLYAMVGGAIVVGLGIGFVAGSASKGSDIANKARNDARELSEKVKKTNEGLGKLKEIIQTAQADLNNTGQISATSLEAFKGWSSGFSAADLKGRELGQFGEDASGKLVNYANKIAHIGELHAAMIKGGGLEGANAQLKAFAVPRDHARWGVKINRGSNEVPMTTAELVDFGDAVNLKSKEVYSGDKEKKLKVKSGELDVAADPKNIFDKSYVSAIDGKDWLKACPVYGQVVGYTGQGFQRILEAIEGGGDDPGAVKPGDELATKLASLAK
jgi:hypothetical protein